MIKLKEIQQIDTMDATIVYWFKVIFNNENVDKTRAFGEIFDLSDIENITLHKDGFSLHTYAGRSYKYYFDDKERQVHKLAHMIEQRFRGALHVYEFYPNIKQESNP